MAWPLLAAVAGMAMGKMKHDREKSIEDSDRKLASATERYSPWTHMQSKPIRMAGSDVGEVLQGGMSGAAFGQQFGGGGGAVTPQEGPKTAGGFDNFDTSKFDFNNQNRYRV